MLFRFEHCYSKGGMCVRHDLQVNVHPLWRGFPRTVVSPGALLPSRCLGMSGGTVGLSKLEGGGGTSGILWGGPRVLANLRQCAVCRAALREASGTCVNSPEGGVPVQYSRSHLGGTLGSAQCPACHMEQERALERDGKLTESAPNSHALQSTADYPLCRASVLNTRTLSKDDAAWLGKWAKAW